MSNKDTVVGGPLAVLRLSLQRLRREQGEPSLRKIAARTHGAISHATVSTVLAAETLPRWGQVEVVVEALDGDGEHFRKLWVAARDQQDLPAVVEDPLAGTLPDTPSWSDLPQTMPELEAARTTVEDEIAQKRRQENDLARELFEAREERADREDEIGRLRSRVIAEETRRRYLEEEISRLENTRDRLTKRINQLESSLAVVHEDLAQLEREKAALAERRSDLRWDWARHEEAERIKLQRQVQDLQYANRGSAYDFTELDVSDLRSALNRAQEGLDKISGAVVKDAISHLFGQLSQTLEGTENRSALSLLSMLGGAVELSSQLDSHLNEARTKLSEYRADTGL